MPRVTSSDVMHLHHRDIDYDVGLCKDCRKIMDANTLRFGFSYRIIFSAERLRSLTSRSRKTSN